MDEWYKESTYLVLLAARDEDDLIEYVVQASRHNLTVSVWHEPDMDNAVTAVAIAPSDVARRLLASLPLTLREMAET